MMRIIWSNRSIDDLKDIFDYIKTHHFEVYARYQIERILQSVDRLIQFPEIGRKVPEFLHLPHREIIVNTYRVFYRVTDKGEIFIVTIVHGKRLLKNASI